MSRGATRERRASVERSAADPPVGDPRSWVMNGADVRADGAYVLYWCRAYRRPNDNLALDRAVDRANELGLPLVVYEALDVRYPYANDRVHTFVLQGACEMAQALAARNAAYGFYLPHTAEQARNSRVLEALAARAAVLVTDWYPPVGGASSLWARTPALAARIGCLFECYDDAAIVPLSLFHKHETAARTIRPKVQRALPESLRAGREPRVLQAAPRIEWPFAPLELAPERVASLVAACAIDHGVAPVAATVGGGTAARARLQRFVHHELRGYADGRNDMARVASSGLSAYLHFGHISAREVALAAQRADAPPADRDAFIEELTVRRALAFNHVTTEPSHAEYSSLPAWARQTLAEHASDPRPFASTLARWESAQTADPLWNAAQRELLRDGTIHPYARMLWGKVALTLAARPEDAYAWLLYLNDKYALDGRDPNSYANIAWCFGLHDHPFPTRAIYGSLRSMTSRSAAQKWDTDAYLARVGAPRERAQSARRPRAR